MHPSLLLAIAVLASAHAMLKNADAGLDEGGHPANENDGPANMAGEIADEFGGAGGAIDSAEAQPAHRG